VNNKKRSSVDKVNAPELVTDIIDEDVTELVTDIRSEPQPSIENPTYSIDALALYSEMGADRYVVSTISTTTNINASNKTYTSLMSIESNLSIAIDKAVNLCSSDNTSTNIAGITISNELKKVINYVYDSNTGHVLKYNKDNYIPTHKAYVYEVRR
jgi:hypothetical protein